MLAQIQSFISEHGTAIATAGMAVVHFAHLAWPRLVAIFRYCRDNGGAVGIVKQFLYGRLPADPANPKP